MQSINLSLPDEIKRESNLNAKLQLSLAVGMFMTQEISLAKAAQVAGKSLDDFINLLKTLGIPYMIYTDEMLKDDLCFANG